MSFFRCCILFYFIVLAVFQSCSPTEYKLEDVSRSSENAYYRMNIRYPVLHGREDVQFNTEIESFLKRQLANIAKQSRVICERDNEAGNLLPVMDLTYEILQKDDVFLTIRFSTYIEWNNDFSPSLYYDCFNYSIKDHRFIHLDNYLKQKFSDQVRALNAIRKICETHLFNQEEVYCQSILKSEKEEDFFENFSLTSKQLLFKFDNTALETNMCGNPEVSFTEKELQDTYEELKN